MSDAASLTLMTALRVCEAAVAEAESIGALVSVAVVDAGGHLVAFTRMDGAEIAGPVLAPDKAYTAVANRIATHELAEQAAPGGPLFGLHAHASGRFVIFGGGIPFRLGDRVVGAVGVSGGTVPEDVACAHAGERAWRREITAGQRDS
ncbi:GlcG/HbpS family heme-binding protein [Actinoallomurus soli]|uniref:GlcG/HbpS family heme-binding protein n=1 Tax=Actinoallomurus soli TaxID=2952535 RepID=UPI002093602C|nr:heme-binding protein [Actinoallomurus soli]MCO5975028.1 heme-binding protein [Actinoallomurus soli]